MEQNEKLISASSLENKTSKEKIEEVATNWIRAFNEQNIENLLDLYSEDAIHFSPRLLKLHPETSGKIQGKEAMQKWWSDVFKRMPSLRYEKINFEIGDDQVLITYKRKVKAEPDSVVKEILRLQKEKIIESKVLS